MSQLVIPLWIRATDPEGARAGAVEWVDAEPKVRLVRIESAEPVPDRSGVWNVTVVVEEIVSVVADEDRMSLWGDPLPRGAAVPSGGTPSEPTAR